MLVVEFVLTVSQHQGCLPHAAFSEQDNFERVGFAAPGAATRHDQEESEAEQASSPITCDRAGVWRRERGGGEGESRRLSRSSGHSKQAALLV